MKRYFENAKKYIIEQNEQFIGIAVVAALILLTVMVVVIVKNSGPRIDYQPAKACDLFTPSEAKDLLGEKVFQVDTKAPEITGNVATSKCSYNNSTEDTTNLIVAALAVRSAINDEGVLKNKSDFAQSQSNNSTDTITGLGESAYFNKSAGQLNILNKRSWIIISYGLGSSPEANTPEKAVELAKIVLQ